MRAVALLLPRIRRPRGALPRPAAALCPPPRCCTKWCRSRAGAATRCSASCTARRASSAAGAAASVWHDGAGSRAMRSARRRVYACEAATRITQAQGGRLGIFDNVLRHPGPAVSPRQPRPWEEAVEVEVGARAGGPAAGLAWDFARLRSASSIAGRRAGWCPMRSASRRASTSIPLRHRIRGDVFLTAQGAPHPMRWRGVPLLKTVFDMALYPMLLGRAASGDGAGDRLRRGGSAMFLADHLALLWVAARRFGHIEPPLVSHQGVVFDRGDCTTRRACSPDLLACAPRPCVGDRGRPCERVRRAAPPSALDLRSGDMLVVEDSDRARGAGGIRRGASGAFLVDTRYTISSAATPPAPRLHLRARLSAPLSLDARPARRSTLAKIDLSKERRHREARSAVAIQGRATGAVHVAQDRPRRQKAARDDQPGCSSPASGSTLRSTPHTSRHRCTA